MRTGWLVVVAAVAACKKEPVGDTRAATADAAAVAEVDALWKLAPKSAAMGGVITGKALVLVDRAFAFVHGIAGAIPGGEDAVAEIDRARGLILGGRASYAEAGLALDRGAAWFSDGKDAFVGVVPVGDRDKFLAAHFGRRDGDVDRVLGAVCKPIGAYYACAERAADLELGGGNLGTLAGVRGLRGDAELIVDVKRMPALPPGLPVQLTGPITAAITIRRGELVLRAHAPATVSGPLAPFAAAKPASIDIARVSGFVVLPVDAVAGLVPPLPVVPGLTVRDLFASFAGPFQVTVPAGLPEVDARVALTDPGPATALLARCGDLAGGPIPFTAGPGSCSVGPVPPMGITGVVWVDGKTLRAARKQGKVPSGTDASPPSAAARELATYKAAYWGRGSLIGDIPPGIPAIMRPAFSAMAYLAELGMGADVTPDGFSFLVVGRTIHANPDDVVAALEQAIGSGADRAAVDKIAALHPGTPLAADVAAGPIGLMMPATTVGMLSAVAIPAFLDYQRHAAATASPGEASLVIDRIAKSARVAYLTNGSFPVGTAARTPASSCCVSPAGRCRPDPMLWRDPVWTALDMAIDDPFRNQYTYQGTATEFTATAIMDLDCDGQEATLTAHGTVDAQGNPAYDITTSGTD